MQTANTILESPYIYQQIYLLTKHNYFRFIRATPQIVSSIVFPAILMIFFFIMFDVAASEFELGAYIQRLLPSMLMTSVTFGSIPMAVTLQSDIHSGFFQRMRTISVWPYSLVAARILFDVLRVLISSVVLLLVAFTLGYEFIFSIESLVYFIGILVLASIFYSCLSFTLALIQLSTEILTSMLSAFYMCSIFASLGLGTIEAFPEWIHQIVIYNPVSLVVESIRQIAIGVYTNLSNTAIYFAIIIIIMGMINLFVFRRLTYRIREGV